MSASRGELLTSEQVKKADYQFGPHTIHVYSASEGQTIDLTGHLEHPEKYRGRLQVDQVIDHGSSYRHLNGTRYEEELNPDDLAENGIFIAEFMYGEAKRLADSIGKFGSRAMETPSLHSDRYFAQEYLEAVRVGYNFLRGKKAELGLDDSGIPVSILRAGAICTRLARGKGKDAYVKDEQLVAVKRAHLEGVPRDQLVATVRWLYPDKVRTMNGKSIEIADGVLATGASDIAAILGAMQMDSIPSHVLHTAIMGTHGGILTTMDRLGQLGIPFNVLTLGVSRSMNDQYYLDEDRGGNQSRKVGDLGDILVTAGALPTWLEAEAFVQPQRQVDKLTFI